MLNFLFVRLGRVDRAVQIKGRVKREREREREREVLKSITTVLESKIEVNHNGFREQN